MEKLCKCYYCDLTSKLEWEYPSSSLLLPLMPIQEAIIPVICNRNSDGTPSGLEGFRDLDDNRFSISSFYYASLGYTLGLIRILDYDIQLDIAMHEGSVGEARIGLLGVGKKIECYVDPDKGIEKFLSIRKMKAFY